MLFLRFSEVFVLSGVGALVLNKTCFFDKAKTPEAATHRSTGLLSKNVASCQHIYFCEKQNAGGRRAQEHRTFVKMWFLVKTLLFILENKRRRQPRTGAQDFCKKCGSQANDIIVFEKTKTPGAAAHRSTGLLSKTCGFWQADCFFR